MQNSGEEAKHESGSLSLSTFPYPLTTLPLTYLALHLPSLVNDHLASNSLSTPIWPLALRVRGSGSFGKLIRVGQVVVGHGLEITDLPATSSDRSWTTGQRKITTILGRVRNEGGWWETVAGPGGRG